MSGLYPRHLLPFAVEAMGTFPVLVVEGARQVGKSTFAGLLVDGRPARVVNLDDRTMLEAARSDPQSFVEQAAELTLVIDEVQRVPDLILAIKLAVDRGRVPGRFVLTGSSDLLRLERTPDSLAGRAVTAHLGPLSQGELHRRRDDFVAWLLSGADVREFRSSWSRADYAGALARGGYPEVQSLEPRFRQAWQDSYLTRIIQRDAAEVLATPNPGRLRALLRLMAANQAGEYVRARLAAAADIPAASVPNYLDTLRTLFLVTLIEPWTANLTRREVGRAKAFVTDSALAMRLSRLTDTALTQPTGGEHFGSLLEGFVAGELIKQQGWSTEDFQLYHFRDRNGLEVDLIVELDDGRVFGIEVKATQSVRSDDFKGLRALGERLGDRLAGGIVLATGADGAQFGERLWSLPVSGLWEAGSS